MTKGKKIGIAVGVVVVVVAVALGVRTMNNRILPLEQAPKSYENLKAALQGETTAYDKYIKFAEQAGKEGNTNTQKLFLATAEAELIHINKEYDIANQMQVLERPTPETVKVGSSAENLQSCVDGERYEAEQMYPEFFAAAEQEKYARTAKVFRFARDAEASHALLFGEELKIIEGNTLSDSETYYYLCPVCGKLEQGKASAFCPICGTPGMMFKKF